MMSLFRKIIAVVLIINIAVFNVSYALFDDNGAGARAPGMGDAVTAIADDVDALHYNPAGLTQLESGQISSMFGQFLNGLDDGSNVSTTYVGYATPLRRGQWGSVGISYHNFKVSNLLTERTLSLGYGWNTRLQPFGLDGILSLGSTIKHLHHEFEPDRFRENALNDVGTATGSSDPLLSSGLNNTAFALDIGSLYRFGRGQKYSAGLMIRNINQPDVSLSGSGEKAPLSLKFGLGYKPRWGLLTTELRRIKRLSSVTDTEAAIGAERRFEVGEAGAFTLRGGYATGSRNFKAANMGATYEFSRAKLDYAFNFPIGNLDETQGTHRLGFSFKVGAISAALAEMTKERKYDLLAAFNDDAKTSYVLLKRSKKNFRLNAPQRFTILQYLLAKYAGSKEGIKDIRSDITSFLSTKKYNLEEWPTIKATIMKSLKEQDKINLGHALDATRKGDTTFGLARMGLLSEGAKKDHMVKTITASSHGELAAQAYRAQDIDGAINHVRQILEVMPNDEVVTLAYRQLLLMRTQPTQPKAAPAPSPTPRPVETPRNPAVQINVEDPGFNQSPFMYNELPEAPAALTAPVPVVEGEDSGMNVFDADVRAFGTSLGYYFTRKKAGASNEERMILLQQMKQLYGNKGIDMSLVDREILLVSGQAAPQPAPKPSPTPKPVPVVEPVVEPVVKPVTPAPVKIEKPKAKYPAVEPKKVVTPADPEVERYWRFYQEAVKRGISDHERIELLERILIRFGESTADKVNKELDRLRSRAY